MPYACPVCDTVQADGEHLANHLAITAIRGDGEHESWLDRHAPGWGAEDPPGLAARVVDEASPVSPSGWGETDIENPGPARTRARSETGNTEPDDVHRREAAASPERESPRAGSGPMDERTRDVLSRARKLTAEMHRIRSNDAGDGGSDSAGEETSSASEGTAPAGEDDESGGAGGRP